MNPMSAARLDVWSWVLIFGGLLAFGPGIALLRAGADWGWLLIAAGAIAAVLGVVLIWLRSRLPADRPGP